MAEFRKVMEQWRRFCKSHSNCGECEFDGKGICGEAHLSDVSYSDIELRIMAWAAEHPEPVYPTWADWMYDNFLIWCQNKYPGRMKDAEAWFDYLYETPIPADIAEKLGAKPKESV